MINRFYLQNQELIQKQFFREGIVVLFDILTPEILAKIKIELSKTKWTKDHHILTYSYSTALLTPVIKHLISSPEFQHLIFKICQQKASLFQFQLISCTWKNYTLLHDSQSKPPKYEIILDFTDDWDPKAGGFITYTNGTGEYTKLPQHNNMLAVINRKYHPHKFIQYCNHYAQEKQRMILFGSIHPK